MPLVRSSMLFALATVFVCGCSDVNAPAVRVTVRATIDRAQFHVGDDVTVAAEIRNEGGMAARVSGSLTAFLEVRDASNRVVFFGRSGTFAAVGFPPRTLEPGERISDSPVWATTVIGEGGGDAPPGTYRVRAAVLVLPRSAYVLDAAGSGYVYSEPIEVTVVSR